MLRPVCSLPAEQLALPRRLLTPRSGTKVSLHTWGLLPGAPTLTGTGLAPVGEVQRAMSASVPLESESIITSRRTTRVLLLQMARPSGNVDHDLHPLLTAQTLNPLLDHSVERDGLDPTLERVAAAGHLRDDGRKGVHGERHTGKVYFRHQEVEGRYDDRLVVDRHHHRGPIDSGAVQHRGKGLGHPRRVDRGIRTAASGEIADCRHHIARGRIEQLFRAEAC